MCCHTGLAYRRHRAWHPTPSQYTDTGSTCRCAIHWCGASHWNTQLPILMYWVRSDREILPRPSIHTPTNAQLYGVDMVVVSQNFGRKCTVLTGSWTRDMWCVIRSPTAASAHRQVSADVYISFRRYSKHGRRWCTKTPIILRVTMPQNTKG